MEQGGVWFRWRWRLLLSDVMETGGFSASGYVMHHPSPGPKGQVAHYELASVNSLRNSPNSLRCVVLPTTVEHTPSFMMISVIVLVVVGVTSLDVLANSYKEIIHPSYILTLTLSYQLSTDLFLLVPQRCAPEDQSIKLTIQWWRHDIQNKQATRNHRWRPN